MATTPVSFWAWTMRPRERSAALDGSEPTIAWLGETACHDPLLTGGKAANLSRLAHRYRVPTGFCVTSAVFDADAAATGDLAPEVREQIHAAYSQLAARLGREDP